MLSLQETGEHLNCSGYRSMRTSPFNQNNFIVVYIRVLCVANQILIEEMAIFTIMEYKTNYNNEWNLFFICRFILWKAHFWASSTYKRKMAQNSFECSQEWRQWTVHVWKCLNITKTLPKWFAYTWTCFGWLTEMLNRTIKQLFCGFHCIYMLCSIQTMLISFCS